MRPLAVPTSAIMLTLSDVTVSCVCERAMDIRRIRSFSEPGERRDPTDGAARRRASGQSYRVNVQRAARGARGQPEQRDFDGRRYDEQVLDIAVKQPWLGGHQCDAHDELVELVKDLKVGPAFVRRGVHAQAHGGVSPLLFLFFREGRTEAGHEAYPSS